MLELLSNIAQQKGVIRAHLGCVQEFFCAHKAVVPLRRKRQGMKKGKIFPEQGKRQRECRQCGTCCRKGGPALRREDLGLVRGNIIRHDQLLTIRKGELGHNPASGRLEPVPVELLKIRGQGRDWACLFLNEADNSCAIYARRPATCALLECWRPEALLATIYQETLRRADLLNPADPLLDYIARHERECPGEEWSSLLCRYSEGRDASLLVRLTELVRTDLALRQRLARETGLGVELEFFLLGRPFLAQLAGSGLVCVEDGGELSLQQGNRA